MRIVIIGTVNLYSSIIAGGLFADPRWKVVGMLETRRVFSNVGSATTRLFLGRYSSSFFAFKIAETLLYRGLERIGLAATSAIDRRARQSGAPLVSIRRVNSRVALRRLLDWRPDLIVSVSASESFGAELLAIPRLGTVNVHASALPDHRGLAPYFWALHAGDRSTGVTVHWIDRGLDTGPIIRQRSVAIESSDSVQDLFLRCSLVAAGELREAVAAIADDRIHVRRQEPGGSYHAWPSRTDVKALRARGHSLWDPRKFIRAVHSV